MANDQTTEAPDPITELVNLRAWMLHRAFDIEAIAELPARKRGPEAMRIAERIKAAVSTQRLVDACARRPRFKYTDLVPRDFLDIEDGEFPICPECGGETGLIASPIGRWWNCDCGWGSEDR